MATAKKSTTKKTIKSSAVIQFQGAEYSEADCIKKATAAFKKAYKGVELEALDVYIKPEEHKIYYVGNSDRVGSVDL